MPEPENHNWLNKAIVSKLALLALTTIALYVCYLIALPFLPALVLALALGVAAYPLHQWVKNRLHNPTVSAFVSVALIALLVIVPLSLAGRQIVREANKSFKFVRQQIESGEWRAQIEQNERLAVVLRQIETEVDLQQALPALAERIPGLISRTTVSAGWFIAELLIAFFTLFYFFRDHEKILAAVREILPVSDAEADLIFRTAGDTIYATVTGVFLVSLVQGTLAGIMFWLLGLPAAAMWGLIMAILAMLPVVGTWMIWLPAAAYLALTGNPIKGLILVGWGITAVSMIDNVLYPVLVGDRLRLHTLSVFISLLGGIVLFGAIGIILGPLTLALTLTLLEIWRKRAASDENLEAV